MTGDILKIIGNMKKTVLDRCRDRIDKAAVKCKDIKTSEEIHGVTSSMKRKHGL
jgi:hypothetical protein